MGGRMKARWINKKYNDQGSFTYGKIYTLYKPHNDDNCYLRDDNHMERNLDKKYLNEYFSIIKQYPNVSFFKKMYPNGEVNGNFWEVPIE